MEAASDYAIALLEIIFVNIVLSGDNAVVIALACRSLPPVQRRMGIMLGAGAAVVLRTIFTTFVAYLMTIPYLKIVGGVLLFWVGFKLMLPEAEHDDDNVEAAGSLFNAFRIILVADAVMSLDNVIAIAAAAHEDMFLLVTGLLISVPIVMYGGQGLMTLITRYPAIITLGGAVIGYVGGEVLVSDPVLEPSLGAQLGWLHVVAPIVGAIGIVATARIAIAWAARNKKAGSDRSPS